MATTTHIGTRHGPGCVPPTPSARTRPHPAGRHRRGPAHITEIDERLAAVYAARYPHELEPLTTRGAPSDEFYSAIRSTY